MNFKTEYVSDAKDDFEGTLDTPPLWTDLVKILTSKPGHSSSFLLECTNFKNVIFEKIPLPLSEVAEVAEVKQPQNPKRQKF